jgi:hypothetical protein
MTFHDGTKSAQARIGLGAFFGPTSIDLSNATEQEFV